MLPVYGTLLAVTVPVGTLDHTASTKVCTYIRICKSRSVYTVRTYIAILTFTEKIYG